MDVKLTKIADVVSLRGYRRAMVYNPITEVEAYWEALRGVRVVPLRSEIDPRGIERALENTFLLERIAPGLARFRLAGQRLSDLMGMEVRGMPLTSLLNPPSREESREALNMLFEGPKALTMALRSEGSLGRPALDARMVILPLKSDLGDISRAIGCLVVDGKIGRTPRRFDIASIRYRDLDPFRTAQPDPAPETAPEADGVPEFSEPSAGFHSAPAGQRPHLRLVKGGGTDD